MAYRDIIKRIRIENPTPISDEVVRLLSKIAENILKDPTNVRLRTLQKSNSTISKKILPAKGAVDCLKVMGFHENETSFIMPLETSLVNLKKYKDEIEQNNHVCNTEGSSEDNATNISSTNVIKKNNSCIHKIELPAVVFNYTNPFLRRMETYFHDVLQYEDKNLQERARKLVPLLIFEENAQRRLRCIQEMIKKRKLEDSDISIQDTMILELLRWFKEDFFSWVDSPECEHCSGETTFSHMSTDPQQLLYTNRVELHRCKVCHKFTPFPRYTDLNILLETRRGRCGEYANTFTLFCRALGWDARLVVDEGDHVWTEVYSVTQKRWLHCDACENICDSPLLYESGWHKKISYVIAYSADEIQDVTWRYTTNHKGTLKLRNKCSETELLSAIFKLKNIRQKDFSKAKKNYLTRRLLNELVEFLMERKPDNNEQKGRISGSATWKLARGEIKNSDSQSPFVWQINDEEIVNNEVILKYSACVDAYEYISGNKCLRILKGWNEGTLEQSEIFRKEEKDWKKVYLARREGSDLGKISWKVELKNPARYIDTIKLHINYSTFENGIIEIEVLFDGNKKVILPKGETMIMLTDLHSSSLTISVSLSGGKGEAAWQHAQLFRQSSDDNEFPMSLVMTVK